ncbi:MAG: hypothetical protein RO257_09095 [Candidatus Kapabacteria bacterium]|nr:hypothetical protein [Candidatus Kapabacteria bacterium]
MSKVFYIIIGVLIMSIINLFGEPTEDNGGAFMIYYFKESTVISGSIGSNSNFLILDMENNRYQIYNMLEVSDMGFFNIVSQCYCEINNDQIKLTDKNSSLIFLGSITKDSIILKHGIKYLNNKVMKNYGKSTSIIWDGLIKYLEWDKEYTVPEFTKNTTDSVLTGKYSDKNYQDLNFDKSGFYIELKNNQYEIYLKNNSVKFEISEGTWQLNQGKVQLADDDNVNIFTFIIIDNKTIVPSSKLPFTNKIELFRLSEKK